MHVERLARRAATLAAAASLALAAAAQPRSERLAACAACHGPGGHAQLAQMPSLAGQPKLFIENQLVLIREGLRDVPAMKAVMAGIEDSEISALASHFAAQPAAAAAGPVQPEKVRLGAETARARLCGTCHLADYTGQNQVPRLAGQNEDYLVQSMKQFRDNPGPGRDTIMAATLRGLNDVELGNLAHYLARFKR
jgi:cytochrome c553